MVKVADDWFPIELKLIDLVVDGIVVTGPSFKKVVATKGLLLEVNVSVILGGKFIFCSSVEPIIFKSTLPVLAGFFEIRFLEAAAKSSGLFKLNFIEPALVWRGDITKPSPSWGCPIISILYPSNWIWFP